VDAFLATHRERFLQLPVMGILSRHPALLHRNFKIFLLQWVRDGDVERRRGETSMVLLDSDVARFLVGAFDLVLLLDDYR
jgi:hypothetical protein